MNRFLRSDFLFSIGVAIALIVPSIGFAGRYTTFIHPSRPEILIALFAGTLAVWWLASSRELRFSRAELLLFCSISAFALWSGISAAWANSTSSVAHHTTLWVCYLAVFGFASQIFDKIESIRVLAIVLCVAIIVLAFPIVLEYHWTMAMGEQPSLGMRYSRFTEVFNTCVALPIFLFLSERGKIAILGLCAAVTVALANLASVSRTGIGVFVLVIVGCVFLTLAFGRFHEYRRRAMVATATIALFVTASFGFGLAVSSQLPIAQRISDPSTTLSAYVRPFFAAISLEMWRAHPIVGVGADNFGQEINKARESYAQKNPSDPNLVIGEAEIAERAHNEYLQVLSELGVVGASILAVFLCVILFFAFRMIRARDRVGFERFAALLGIAAFLASSLVTSYSFRLATNGMIFFLMLAVAVRGIGPRSPDTNAHIGRPASLAFAIIVIFATGALLYVSGYRLYAVHLQRLASDTRDESQRESLVQDAIDLDPENANFYSTYGWHFLEKGKPADAAVQFRKAIDAARSTSIDYSSLAGSQMMAGDINSAIETLDEATTIYPRSVFLRVRYASILAAAGRSSEAELQFEKARSLNDGQARSWRNLMDDGARNASIRSHQEGLPQLMELTPEKAMYQIKSERELRFPDEKFEMPQN